MRILVRVIIILLPIGFLSCSTRNTYKMDDLTGDSLFIENNIIWKNPSTDWKATYKDTNFLRGYANVELVRIFKNRILIIRASVSITSDDTLHLFSPPEYGGQIIEGRISKDDIIESKVSTINGQKIYWLSPIDLQIKNKYYEVTYEYPQHSGSVCERGIYDTNGNYQSNNPVSG